MFDTYYFIYGIKLHETFKKKLIDYVVERGDCDLEMIEDSCRENGWEWEEIKNTDKRYDYVDMEYLENFIFEDLECLVGGDCFVGKVLWSTADIDDNYEPADLSNLPYTEMPLKKRIKIQQSVDSFIEMLPEDLVDELPSIGFYWCIEGN